MRQTDRLITPGVVVTGLLVCGGLIGLLIAAAAWLTYQGLEIDPMIKLVGVATAAVVSLGNLGLSLGMKATAAKTERNTGVLMNHTGDIANAVYEVADALPRPVPRHSAGEDTVQMGAAPALRGS